MVQYDVAVIGGGILGLATAMELSARYAGLSLVVLEKEREVAAHQTGHNSGVIHSGLYYRPGSRKAVMAVRGAEQMVGFAAEHGIAHERCGKVVVATQESQVARLDALALRGEANGVPDISVLGPEALREYEPHAAGVKALHVPSTGIVDYIAVAQKYRELTESRGGEVRLGCRVRGIQMGSDGVRLSTDDREVAAQHIVNCGGLLADRVAKLAGARPPLQIVPFRGEYYELKPEAHDLVRNLIYPVPDARFPFLGVHLTRMIGGGIEAGPNAVLAFSRAGYGWGQISPRDLMDSLSFPGTWKLFARHMGTGLGEVWRSFSKQAFAQALSRLVPELKASDLTSGGSGVRAQALGPDGVLLDDFHFEEGPAALHVLSAPSPAATASLAIGEEIAQRALALRV